MRHLDHQSWRYPMRLARDRIGYAVDRGRLSGQLGQSPQSLLRDGYLADITTVLISQQKRIPMPSDDGRLGIVRGRVDHHPVVRALARAIAAVEALGDDAAATLRAT